MDFRSGDKVWVKRRSGQWWPGVVETVTVTTPVSNQKRKRTNTCVRYPFEDASEVIGDARRIKSFDCPDFEQLTQGNERSTRKRSFDKDSFQRALAALLDNSISTEKQNEPSNQLSNESLKRSFLSVDLPDMTPSKRMRAMRKCTPCRRPNFGPNDEPSENEEQSSHRDSPSCFSDKDDYRIEKDINAPNSVRTLSKERDSPSCHENIGERRSCVESAGATSQDTTSRGEEEEEKPIAEPNTTAEQSNVEIRNEDSTNESATPDLNEMPSSCQSTDQVDENEDEDDDDDLPVFSLQSPAISGSNYRRGDIVWAKFVGYPPWPAVVRTVYKKRHKLTKVSVLFIGDGNKIKKKGFCLKPNKIQHFCDENNRSLEQKDDARVREVVKMVDDYLTKRALGKTQLNPFEYFEMTDEDPSEEEEVDDEGNVASRDVIHEASFGDVTRGDDVMELVTSQEEREEAALPRMPEHVLRELQRSVDRSRKLVEFIGSPECRDYARRVLRGGTESRLHREFDPDDKNATGGFGPIEDEDQVYEIYDTLMKICNEEKFPASLTHRHLYVSTVLAPETIVFALRTCRRYTAARAWAAFHRGAVHSRALLDYEHETLVAGAQRMPADVLEQHRALQARRCQRLLDKFNKAQTE